MTEDDSQRVYSIEKGRICLKCNRPLKKCTCRHAISQSQAGKKPDGIIRLRKETKGRGGKTVTTISGFDKNDRDIKITASKLKYVYGKGIEKMRLSTAILFLMALMVLPAMSIADTIHLKTGRRIEANTCWEEGDLVICKKYGATIGYRKNDISSYQITGEKPSEQVRIDESEITGQYQIGITDKIQSMWSYDGESSIAPELATAKIRFTIMQNGEIQDIDFIELSKDPFLNIAAFSAIMKSLPFTSFPPEIKVMNLKLFLIFTFEGVQ